MSAPHSSNSKDKEFVHLHVHTDYSLLDGCSRIDRLCQRASELGMKALSITDHGVLFGLASFFKTAQKHGIKPLLGCEIYLVYEDKLGTANEIRAKQKSYHMGLLARNETGYRNLTQLVSKAHTEGFYRNPRTDMTELAAHAEGLIAFSGCLAAVIPQFLMAGDYAAAREACGRFVDIFGKDHFIIELMDHGLKEQQSIIPDLLKLAQEFNLKVVCTNDVHYVKDTDWRPHDSLLCIQTGARLKDEQRMRYDSNQFYLKSRDEMQRVFAEVPQSLTNTSAVAEMCELRLPFGEDHYPVFEKPTTIHLQKDVTNFERILEIYIKNKNKVQLRNNGELCTLEPERRQQLQANGCFLFEICKQGLKERYGADYDAMRSGRLPDDTVTSDHHLRVCDQLDYELAIIIGTGFCDYFLIVWDFINWARNHNIPVGPGRGSGAGCLVAYVLKITDIDPLRFGLLFERMLNLERVSPPDFDVDFCMRRRDEVVDYVRNKYGQDRVANIITFGTFGAKMVVRDLARVNDVPYAEADKIAKMVPDELNISLQDAVAKSAELRNEIKVNPIAKSIIEQGAVIEGMVRNTGKHACGVIIADQPITNLIPVTLQEGALTTQYPKGPSEDLGLLKMDFLGLKTLTVIADAQENIRRTRNMPDFDIEKVSLEDPTTFQLLKEARTIGVFQLESGGMQSLCRQLGVSNIDEIVALIALYRPGPMQFIPQYIEGKKDPRTIKVPHPLLQELVAETYGVLVYQEQVMEAARIIAGYSLGDADILRRAMGKKIQSVMDEQKQVFIDGAKQTNRIEKKKAEEIFGILEKFAQYGFNKSHSAAYAMLSYRTAYLKANYPTEFMAALLSSELGNADKVAHFVEEAETMGIDVLGPDINESRETFTPIVNPNTNNTKPGSIRFGMAAIKGVGDAAAIKILEERERNGPFLDFKNFVERIDGKQVNRRVLECLARSGAFDCTGIDRQHILDSIDKILSEVAELIKDRETGQRNLFDLLDATADDETNSGNTANPNSYLTHGPIMSTADKLKYEKELLGFYISGHPMNAYDGMNHALNTLQGNEDLSKYDREGFRLCGVVNNLSKRLTKKDNRPWALFTLSTRRHNFAMNCFPEAYESHCATLEEGNIVSIEGEIRYDSEREEVRFNVQRVSHLANSLSALITAVTFYVVNDNEKIKTFATQLSEYLQNNEGPTQVRLAIMTGENQAMVAELASSLRCRLSAETFQQLRHHRAVIGTSLSTKPVAEPAKKQWGSGLAKKN